jgi:hypothetical protein
MRDDLKGMLRACSAAFSRLEKIYIFSAIGAFAAGLALVLLLADSGRSGDVARVEAPANESDRFTYDLPLIVLQVPNAVESREPRSLVVNGSLQFRGKSDRQLTHSIRMAKLLTPSIMDAIMTGMYRQEFDAIKNPAVVNRVVLDQTNIILRPYGVSAERMVMGNMELR